MTNRSMQGMPVADYQQPGVFGPFLQGLVYAVIAAGNLFLVVALAQTPITTADKVLAGLIFALVFVVYRRYDLVSAWQIGRHRSIGTRVLASWAGLVAALTLLGFLTQQSGNYERPVLGVWIVSTPIWFLLVHALVRYGLLRILPGLAPSRSAVIVFVTPASRELSKVLRNMDPARFNLVGYFEDRDPDRVGGVPADAPVLGGTDELVDYVNRHGIEVVFVVLPEYGTERIQQVLDQLGDTTASIYYVPDFFRLDMAHLQLSELGGLPVMTVTETPFFGADGLLKRIMDIVFASTLLLVSAPLFAIIAASVWLTMGRPIFFTQRRYGLNGEEIKVHKFRSMRVWEDSEDIRQAHREDPRVTRLGRFLRRTSIDEWPQFWNVFKGEMSLVGPRPHAVAHNEQYRKLIKTYMARHKVRPGLTGWAQVNGLRGETQDLEDMEARVDYDLAYIRNWSPELDLRIMLMTLWIIFRDREAY